MPAFDESNPFGFEHPTCLPNNKSEEKNWQDQNRNWWELNPMRYDWEEVLNCKPNTKEFFEEIDKRFFSDVHTYLPSKKVPFDSLIDFEGLKNKTVLEIGVGSGAHAQLLAKYSKEFYGIDLTQNAIKSTKKR